MANGTDEKRWKQMMRQQKEEMEEITENFKEFFQNNQDVTSEQLQEFIRGQATGAESQKVRQQLEKRLDAIKGIGGGEDLRGEELKEELNQLSQSFDDKMNVLDQSITKGNQLLSSGFSQVSGVLRDSFGPVFELFETGMSVLTGIGSTLFGIFQFMRAIPTLLGSIKDWFFTRFTGRRQLAQEKEQTEALQSMNSYFKRKEKRELRGGGEDGRSLLSQILIGIGILGVGIIGAFTYMAEMAGKQFLSAFSTIGKVLRAVFINPIIRFLSKFKIGRGMLAVFSKIGNFFKTIFTTGSRISGWLASISSGTSGILKIFAKIASFITKIGGWVGRLILPVMIIYEVVKGLFSEGTIRDKILSASAGVLSIFTKIPEMVANALLSLFGFEFRLNFSKEAIIDAVNTLTKWAEAPIHAILDFFTKTIPDVFSNVKDTIMSLVKKIKQIPEWIGNKIQEILSILPWVGDEGKRPPETKMPRGDKTGSAADIKTGISTGWGNQATEEINKHEKAKAKRQEETNRILKELKAVTEKQAETQSKQYEEKVEQGQAIDMRREPVDEIESMGLLLSNKSWGLG